jgi:hypothetical protein
MKATNISEALGPIPPANQSAPGHARIKVTLSMNSKTPEFFEKSPLSGAGKHPDFSGDTLWKTP